MTTRELCRHYAEMFQVLRHALRETENQHTALRGADTDPASQDAADQLRRLLVDTRVALDTLAAQFHAGEEGWAIVAAGLTERGFVAERARPLTGRESWRERPAENVHSIDAIQHQTPPAA